MENFVTVGIFVIFLFIINCNRANGQTSPCPTIFQYQQDGSRKFGIITIPGPGEGKTIIMAGLAAYGQIYDSNSGGLKLLKNLENAVADAKQGLNVQYTLNFPQTEQWPIITKIDLNYKTICNGPGAPNAPSWKFEHSFTYPAGSQQLSSPIGRPIPPAQSPNQGLDLFACFPNCNIFQAGDPQTNNPPAPKPPPPSPIIPNIPVTPRPSSNDGNSRPDNPAWLNDFRYKSSCGVRENFTPSTALEATELIIGGEPVEIGEYPWMVAMFKFKPGKIEYACGATLITDSHVLTAAHCIQNDAMVQLEFGKHDLSKSDEPGALTRLSKSIKVHPEYVVQQAHADIAVISFIPVSFSRTIKPICIWQFGTNFDAFKKKGIITGWGQVEQGGDSSELPNQLKIERTDIQKCRSSHELLQSLATDKTFCAGGESKGPCHGDSGSGFYINQSNKYYLRGIISTSIGTATACHIDKYAVYADVIYFLEWIKRIIS